MSAPRVAAKAAVVRRRGVLGVGEHTLGWVLQCNRTPLFGGVRLVRLGRSMHGWIHFDAGVSQRVQQLSR